MLLFGEIPRGPKWNPIAECRWEGRAWVNACPTNTTTPTTSTIASWHNASYEGVVIIQLALIYARGLANFPSATKFRHNKCKASSSSFPPASLGSSTFPWAHKSESLHVWSDIWSQKWLLWMVNLDISQNQRGSICRELLLLYNTDPTISPEADFDQDWLWLWWRVNV